MIYSIFRDIIEDHNSNPQNSYSWRIAIFDSCKGIKKYKKIITEVHKWSFNCHIYNMTLNRIRSLLNLANEEIKKGKNELEKLEPNSMLISISIMNAAQYLRYSIESVVSQLVNNNVNILSKNANQINETWRIKSIFKALDENKIDWSIKNLPIVHVIGEQIAMDLKRNHKFNKDWVISNFEYLSDILHDKHILHKKCKIVHAATFEEYKLKEIDLFKKDIFELNKIYEDFYEIICNHSILLENGKCFVIVENFKIDSSISAEIADNIYKY